MFEVSPRRFRSFWLDLAAAKTPCSLNVATATLSVTSRHDDHDLSPKTLRPRAISGLDRFRDATVRDSLRSLQIIVGPDKGFGHRRYLYFSWNYQRGNCSGRLAGHGRPAASEARREPRVSAANRGDPLKKSRTDFFRAG